MTLFLCFVCLLFQNKSKHQGGSQGSSQGQGFTVAMSDSHSAGGKGSKPIQKTSRYNKHNQQLIDVCFESSSIPSASRVPAHLVEFKEILAQLSQVDPSAPSIALHTVVTHHNE